MPDRFDLEYALEQTRVLLAPERRIETFARTQFRFHMISELMDRVDQVRVRSGRVDAERPSIVSPGSLAKLLLEGFGDEAREYAERFEADLGRIAALRYGFVVRKSEVTETVVHDPVEAVVERVLAEVHASGMPSSAVIQGVDDIWEISLLRFTWDLVRRSVGGNFGELRDRGLI